MCRNGELILLSILVVVVMDFMMRMKDLMVQVGVVIVCGLL